MGPIGLSGSLHLFLSPKGELPQGTHRVGPIGLSALFTLSYKFENLRSYDPYHLSVGRTDGRTGGVFTSEIF